MNQPIPSDAALDRLIAHIEKQPTSRMDLERDDVLIIAELLRDTRVQLFGMRAAAGERRIVCTRDACDPSCTHGVSSQTVDALIVASQRIQRDRDGLLQLVDLWRETVQRALAEAHQLRVELERRPAGPETVDTLRAEADRLRRDLAAALAERDRWRAAASNEEVP